MKKQAICWSLLALFLVLNFAAQATPVASNYRFDGRVPIGDDPISARPLVEVQVIGNTVNYSTFVLRIDGVQVTTINPYNFEYDQTDFSYQVTTKLEEGWHTFSLQVSDDDGPMPSPYNFSGFVASQEQEIIEAPLAIPNPASKNMRITYKLTEAGEVYVNIYNLNGELVWQREFSSGQTGAQAGYNEVVWNLSSGFGEKCPNGPYLCVIMKKEDKKIVAMEKLKLFILR